ncbi:MAG: adenylate/guanylate cyclase domain-containing protein, partial [Dehalococcoidia bacterium]
MAGLRELIPLRRLFVVYSLTLILLICLLAVFGAFERPNLFLLDRAFNWRGMETPRQEIVIVAISQEDFERGAPRWPWPRSLMARLIDQISAHEPAVIAIDILYSERSNPESLITREQFSDLQPFLYRVLSGVEQTIQTSQGTVVIGPGDSGFDSVAAGAQSAEAQDLELAAAVQRARDSGVGIVLAAQAVSGDRFVGITEPYPALNQAAGGSLGFVGIRTDSDGVLRNYLPYAQDKEGGFVYGLALAAVAQFRGAPLPGQPLSGGDVQIGNLRVPVDDGRFLVNFRGPPGTHPALVSLDVLKGEGDLSTRLKDRLVFVGVTDPSAEDLIATPFSGSQRMSGVEFHAAAADTLLSGSFITAAPRYQEFLLIIVLALIGVALGRFLKPLLSIPGSLVVAGALSGGWYVSFADANYLLPIASPLAAVAAGFAFSIVERVIVEQSEKQRARNTLSRYLHPDVVKEMIKSPAAEQLGGKRTELTVLFSDIRGFTTLSEQLTPEQVVGLLNEYLSAMTQIIFNHGGTVDKFEGDAILAFFGAPQAHDDDPERAVRTALDMRATLSEMDERWLDMTKTPLRIGIGINTGHAVVGNIGSDLKMD